MMASIPFLRAYPLSPSQWEDFNTYIQENLQADPSYSKDLSMKEAFLGRSGGSYSAMKSSITHLVIKTVSLRLLPILKKKIKTKIKRIKNKN
jgi:hypothetical protein